MQNKTFSGGYRFKRFQGQPNETITSLETPPHVSIPLSQGFGSALEPLIRVGDIVTAGQIIARDEEKVSSPIHSSVSGRVVSIEKKNYFKREVEMVTIETKGNDGYQKIEGSSPQWQKLPIDVIERILYLSGVTSLDREGIPTHFKSSIINPEEVEDLIIHGVGSESHNISLDALLGGKQLFNFVEGVKILKKIMPRARVHIALNSENTSLLERTKKLTVNVDNFFLYPVVPKYPQGYDELLVPTLLGKKFPYGYSAANIGIVVLNIQAVLNAYEAVANGKPLIERTIALCGPSFVENTHVKVKVGTPLEFVLKGRLKDGPNRIILNSLMTGFELNSLSLPVDRTYSQIIALPEDKERKMFAFARPGFKTDSYSNSFASCVTPVKITLSTNLRGEERPCIQCGYCIEVCPVRILPALIHRYSRSKTSESLMQYGIFNCIDCNLCSYVCPSKIPVSNHIKDAKTKLIDMGCDHSMCILPKFDVKGLEEYKGVKSVR